MAIYFLTKATAVQAAPSATIMPQSDAHPTAGNTANPVPIQTFELIVEGIGDVSATAQMYVSNDDDSPTHWSPYMDPITASGANVAMAVSAGNQGWKHYTAIITAISGTNALARVKMSA